MRRTLALAAAMLLLPLAACGDAAGQSAGPPAPASAGATPAPPFFASGRPHPWRFPLAGGDRGSGDVV